MSDYSTSITNLYNLKLTLTQLKEEEDLMLQSLAKREDPRLRRQLQSISSRIVQTQQQINVSVSKLYADPLTDPLLQIEEANPLLLLPLRLETRFANSGTELWIRVYPDEIAIHTHETALTASEIKAGSYYWRNLWENNTSPGLAIFKKKAWSQLANHFGVNRTRWIILKTQPIKLKTGEDFSDIITEADLDPGTVDTKNQAWSEAVKSHVMPDLLKIRMFVADKLVFETQGNPIVQPLAVSPDPMGNTNAADLDWNGTDLAWLENFDKAVEVGMAFKINLSAIPTYNSTDGFSRITVTGIRTLFDQSPLVVSPAVAGTQSLSMLFNNHQYTSRGLALVAQGTPTNNTEEKKSGYKDQPAFSEEQYELELQKGSQPVDPDEMEDGQILALALGVDPTLFQKVENSRSTDHRDAVSMNKALYSATLGFYLGHLLHPLFKVGELDTIRSFFCSYVTGRGPIPVLRKGPQPYGILPTSNFKAFQCNTADKDYKLFQRLTAVLSKVDAVYEAGVPNLSKLGQVRDPHELLHEILSLYPNAESFYQRVGYSENFLRNYLGQVISQPANPLLEQLINTFSTYTGAAPEGIIELKKIVLERTTLLLDRNRLVDIIPVSETKNISIPPGLPPAVHQGRNYIDWLALFYARTPFAGIEKEYYSGTDPRIDPPILYQLLRHSRLNQLYKCVFHWLSSQGFLPTGLSIFNDGTPGSDFIASKEYLNLFQNQADISAMELMLIEAPNLPFLAPGETAASYLLNNADNILRAMGLVFRRRIPPDILNDFRHLKEFIPTLEYLGSLPTARLERAMIEHLDCVTYRLDAWQTALFYKKLVLTRSSGLTTGTVLGAYGWLENLKPASNINFMKEADLPAELQPGTGMPIIKAADQGGYIHAPSLTQAKAAALLRNAYLHHHDPADPQLMAVNLDSLRVRKALAIFEGVQKGHSIGELLGYNLERHLHDQAIPLDKYIPVLRGGFPLGGKTLSNPGDNHDQPSATLANQPADWVTHLDGLAIVNAIKAGQTYPLGLTDLPLTGTEADTIQQGITDLLDSLDAMKDLMVAESIHQLVQGNTERAGALLKSIHELKPPAKFESILTPRTPAGILTHRACMLFKPGDFKNPANPWPSVDMSGRAETEPGLNEWLGEIIGPPDMFHCTVTEMKSRTNGIITLEDLNVQPIDLVYLAPAEFGKDESELSRRIAYHYRKTQNISEEITIEIAYDRAEKNNISIRELLPLLKLLKELITNSKALDAADFDLQHYQGKPNFRNISIEKSGSIVTDIGSLLERKNKLTDSLESLRKKLKQASGSRTATTCADIRECLVTCCDFEMQEAFPVSAAGEDGPLREALLIQAGKALSQIDKMLDSLKKYGNDTEEELVASFAVFFGPAFKVLPVFHFTKNADDEVDRMSTLQKAYDAEKDIFSFITGKAKIPADKLVQNWLNEVLYVRPRLASFEMTRLLYNSFHEKQLGVHIMQLPYESNDSWLGLEFPDGMQPGKGKLSVLLHHFPQHTSPDWTSGFSGLLADEWVEEIPGKEELTGISFQYNQPDSQPPQSLLLAISPTEGKNWNWDTLGDILDDTLRRAKQRAIGTSQLAKTDWIGVLPAVTAEFSDTKANVSLFFRN